MRKKIVLILIVKNKGVYLAFLNPDTSAPIKPMTKPVAKGIHTGHPPQFRLICKATDSNMIKF